MSVLSINVVIDNDNLPIWKSPHCPEHVVLSIVFEKSLQSVNPTLALPYWDFVWDGEWIKRERGGNVSALGESVVFSDEWFGYVAPDAHEITAGRWAAIRVDTNAWDSPVHNSYGILRSPWNNNNLQGITRSMASVCGASPGATHPIPSCETYQSLFALDTWADFALDVPTKGHGALRVNIGGAFGGCSDSFESLLSDADDEDKIDPSLVGKLRV